VLFKPIFSLKRKSLELYKHTLMTGISFLFDTGLFINVNNSKFAKIQFP